MCNGIKYNKGTDWPAWDLVISQASEAWDGISGGGGPFL